MKHVGTVEEFRFDLPPVFGIDDRHQWPAAVESDRIANLQWLVVFHLASPPL